MKVHELKSWPKSFAPLNAGQRHVELRRDDRLFEAGDIIIWREWDPEIEQETGRHRVGRVTFVERCQDVIGKQALRPGWVALSVRIYREPRSI